MMKKIFIYSILVLFSTNVAAETLFMKCGESTYKYIADPAGDNTYTGTVVSASPNPYADVGPYIKESKEVTVTYDAGTENEWSEVRSYTRGDHQDGIVASDVYKYTVSNGIW